MGRSKKHVVWALGSQTREAEVSTLIGIQSVAPRWSLNPPQKGTRLCVSLSPGPPFNFAPSPQPERAAAPAPTQRHPPDVLVQHIGAAQCRRPGLTAAESTVPVACPPQKCRGASASPAFTLTQARSLTRAGCLSHASLKSATRQPPSFFHGSRNVWFRALAACSLPIGRLASTQQHRLALSDARPSPAPPPTPRQARLPQQMSARSARTL